MASTTLYVVMGFITAVAASAIARRILGAPIAWPRSIAVGVLMLLVASPVANFVADRSALPTSSQAVQADPWPSVIIVVLTFAWVFAIGLGILVLLEMMYPTGTVGTPLTWLRRMRENRHHSKRYAEVVAIFIKNGLGGLRRGGIRNGSMSTLAVALRKALTEAGVTFVKVGQLASTRPDLLPPEFIEELSLLQTQVDPVAWDAIVPALEQGLGRPLDQVFANIDHTPLAAASVAQVYAATLLDGRSVVVKVQRPGAAAQVTVDLQILMRLARWAQRSTEWGKALRIAPIAESFAQSLREELDYRIEADNQRAVAAGQAATMTKTLNLGLFELELNRRATGATIIIPAVIPELSGKTVLVMDRVEGVPLGQACDKVAAMTQEQRDNLAGALLGECFHEILVCGTFQSDLHPGNIHVVDSTTLALLDFGSVGRLDATDRQWLALMVVALQRQDAEGMTDALLELMDRPDHLDERGLRRDVGTLVTRFGTGLGQAGTVSVFLMVFQLLQRYGFQMPAQLSSAFRAIGSLDGTLQLLDPGFDIVAGARQQARPLLAQLASPKELREHAITQLLSAAPMLVRLPHRLDNLTEQLAEGRFSINMRLLADPRDRRFIADLVSQAVTALLAIAAIVAGVVLTVADSGPWLTPEVRVYGVAGAAVMLVGFGLALRALIAALRRIR